VGEGRAPLETTLSFVVGYELLRPFMFVPVFLDQISAGSVCNIDTGCGI
jgi:hypothetical protein